MVEDTLRKMSVRYLARSLQHISFQIPKDHMGLTTVLDVTIAEMIGSPALHLMRENDGRV